MKAFILITLGLLLMFIGVTNRFNNITQTVFKKTVPPGSTSNGNIA